MHASASLISIIIPTRNQHRLLDALLNSLILTTTSQRLELIVVDNGSDDPATLDWLDALPDRVAESHIETAVVLRDPAPFNYSRLNNFAIKHAKGNLICLLNDDIEAIAGHDWLDAMRRLAEQADTGCVGAKLLYPDETIQHAGVMVGLDCVAGHPFKGLPADATGSHDYLLDVRHVSAVTAACLMVRREVLDAVGGFDESLPIAWNDVDLCLRVGEAGYRNLWTPHAVLRHHESVSRGRRRRGQARQAHRASIAYMRNKWGTRLDSDPLLEPWHPRPQVTRKSRWWSRFGKAPGAL